MQTMKKAIIPVLIMALLLSLAGCSKQREPVTIYDSETLQIKQQGRELYLYDLAGGSSYTIKRQRMKKTPESREPVQTAKTLIDTDTLQVEAVKGLVIVTDRTAGKVLYIQRKGACSP